MKNNKVMLFARILIVSLVFVLAIGSASASSNDVYFDIEERKSLLQTKEYSQIKQSCMAKNLNEPKKETPKPVMSLKKTKGYGSDRRLGDFAWFVMVHGGRSLAGDIASTKSLKDALLLWTRAQALSKTEEVHDAYYALKRGLLPIIVNYAIVRDDFTRQERKEIDAWLDDLVRRVDKRFKGDVDDNNHRYLADAVLTAWGQLINDKKLYKKGKIRFKEALTHMQVDGGLPLETRRGSRTLWYMRQSLANLIVIAEVYEQNNDGLYDLDVDGKTFTIMMDYYLSAVSNPLLVLAKSAQNHIPGPSGDFMNQDMGMLERRGGKRHYMAFAEKYVVHYKGKDITGARLENLMTKTGFKERPMIDDFVGGNATCFWAVP